MTIVPSVKYIFVTLIFGFSNNCAADFQKLNIAVIGAGPSGIISAKNAIDQGHNVTIFEKTGTLGGVWYFTEKTDKDEYGVEIHSPMYRYLRTNIPKQLMEFPNHPYPNDTRSFPSHVDILKYLDRYARDSHVEELIQYHHLVHKVAFKKNGKWRVTVLRKNLPDDKQKEIHEFDAVFVCSGINFEKRIPNIDGAKKFKGKILHSRAYRTPVTFFGETVLVIGKGPSGHDIYQQLKNIGINVIHSSYEPLSSTQKITAMSAKLCSKGFHDECPVPDANSANSSESNIIRRFMGKNQVVFKDGSRHNISLVIYATGYKYSYPFLDRSVGIRVHEHYVESLYMHILNIERPTMAFIGVNYGGVHFRMYDLQARFALKFISGQKELPSKEFMMEYSYEIVNKKKPHSLGSRRKDYYSSVASAADIENIPDVYPDIYTDVLSTDKFRQYDYEINGNEFIKIHAL